MILERRVRQPARCADFDQLLAARAETHAEALQERCLTLLASDLAGLRRYWFVLERCWNWTRASALKPPDPGWIHFPVRWLPLSLSRRHDLRFRMTPGPLPGSSFNQRVSSADSRYASASCWLQQDSDAFLGYPHSSPLRISDLDRAPPHRFAPWRLQPRTPHRSSLLFLPVVGMRSQYCGTRMAGEPFPSPQFILLETVARYIQGAS